MREISVVISSLSVSYYYAPPRPVVQSYNYTYVRLAIRERGHRLRIRTGHSTYLLNLHFVAADVDSAVRFFSAVIDASSKWLPVVRTTVRMSSKHTSPQPYRPIESAQEERLQEALSRST